MRLLIDLQGAQGGNRHRGIGRLTRALAKAMVANPGDHEPLIFLNDAIPESAEALCDEFTPLLPRANIRFWRGLDDAAAIGGPERVVRRQLSERIRAHAIAASGADAIHVSSVFEGGADDTITNWPADLHRPPHVATFYDAIPLINRDQYLSGAWKHLARWYLRQVQEVRRHDGLMAISESSRSEAMDHLGFASEWVFNIRAGFDVRTFRPTCPQGVARTEFLSRHGLRERYLLFVGAGDPRKNEMGLLQAYGLLPEPLRARHQLVIVGAGDAPGLMDRGAALGLRPGDLLLPRHVAEADLPILYSICHLFIMPSKHEGFGLPALEAMACGAPVIASRTSSLPEVVGLTEALFDPDDFASIAQRMRLALQDDAFRHRLVEHGLCQAAGFTWEESARRAWAALEAMQERGGWRARGPSRGGVPPGKPRLAIVGGLPAVSPEVSRADLGVVSEFARHYDVSLYTRAPFAEDDELGAAFPVHAESDLAAHGARYDRVLYRIGQSDESIEDELLPIFPGIVILRDGGLGASAPNTSPGEDLDGVARAAFGRSGWRAVAALQRGHAADRPSGASYTALLLRDALAVIEEPKDVLADPRAFSAHCREVIEDAYERGVAAQRHACVRALAGHHVPELARAVVQTFPAAGPQRLLLDLSCIEDEDSARGLALREEARRTLVEPEGVSIVEIVRAEGEALWLVRARTAAFLGLPLHGLEDEIVAAAPTDTLVLRADIGSGSPDATLLRKLNRRGVRLVALVLGDVACPSAALSVADEVVCATEKLARAVLGHFEEGRNERRHPVMIGWPGEDGMLLRFPFAERWPLSWRPFSQQSPA